MRVVIILGIPLVIVTTVTLLCIPSYLQQVITDILVPADSLQGTTDVLLTTTVYNRGKLFAVTIPNSTATTMADVAKNQADNLPAIDSGPTTSGGDSAVRLPPTPLHATSRSLISDNTILPQDDNFVVKPSAPLRLVIGDNMTYVNPRSIDRYGKNNMTTDETDIDTRINQTNERCENSVISSSLCSRLPRKIIDTVIFTYLNTVSIGVRRGLLQVVQNYHWSTRQYLNLRNNYFLPHISVTQIIRNYKLTELIILMNNILLIF